MNQPKAYRPDIDGLRAIAVTAVIINHIYTPLLPSGFLGVDIFFAISGFVITNSLIRHQAPRLQTLLISFCERRVKRIIPALLICILITSLLFCLVSETPASSLNAGIWAIFGLSNVHFLTTQTDYFSSSAELNPFLHTWSLGIEEQFYLAYPIIFWVGSREVKLAKRLLTFAFLCLFAVALFSKATTGSALSLLPLEMRAFGTMPYLVLIASLVITALVLAWAPACSTRKKFDALLLLLISLSLISLFCFIILTAAGSDTVYFQTISRFWEIGSGCVLAIIHHNGIAKPLIRRGITRQGLAIAAALATSFCFTLPQSSKAYTIPLVIILSLTLINLGSPQQSPISRGLTSILCLPLLVRIGIISYSLYLWHWPLLVLARWTIGLNALSTPIVLLFTVLFALTSYHWIESPLRRMTWSETPSLTIAKGLTAQSAAAFILLTLTQQISNPLYTGKRSEYIPDLFYLSVKNSKISVGNCNHLNSYSAQDCVARAKPGMPSIILLGDSHAGHLYPAISELRERLGIGVATFNTAGNSHQPFPTLEGNTTTQSGREWAAKGREINAFYQSIEPSIKSGDIVMIAADLERYFSVNSRRGKQALSSWSSDVQDLADRLNQKQASLVMVAPLPHFKDGGGPTCKLEWFRRTLPSHCLASIQRQQFLTSTNGFLIALKHLASEKSNVFIFEPGSLFCPTSAQECSNGTGGTIYYLDSNHLAPSSSSIIANSLLRFLRINSLLR